MDTTYCVAPSDAYDEGGPMSRQCFRASCDWLPYVRACSAFREKIARCPLLDATAYNSLVSTPGLVFLKPGRGFTAPNQWWTGGEPFPHHQGEGRCVNAACRTDDPPTGADNSSIYMEEGDQWCDSIPNWGGRVIQIVSKGNLCYPPGPDAALGPCDDVGKVLSIL